MNLNTISPACSFNIPHILTDMLTHLHTYSHNACFHTHMHTPPHMDACVNAHTHMHTHSYNAHAHTHAQSPPTGLPEKMHTLTFTCTHTNAELLLWDKSWLVLGRCLIKAQLILFKFSVIGEDLVSSERSITSESEFVCVFLSSRWLLNSATDSGMCFMAADK